MQLSREDSEKITCARAFALTSIVAAHTSSVSATDEITSLSSKILSGYGTIGVIIFFIISGFLFEISNKNANVFWKSKIKLIIPWCVCGSLDYLYTALRKGGLGIVEWLSALTVHSHYYYLTVLFILYAIFRLIKSMPVIAKNLFYVMTIIVAQSQNLWDLGFRT